MRTRKNAAAVIAATALTGASLVGLAGPALASSTATADVSAGTFGFVSTPGNPSLGAVTLNGTDQTDTGTLPMDVGDNTGSGNGWNITMTSTPFTTTTSGGLQQSLSASATTVQSAPTDTCDAQVSCTPATNSVTYPVTLGSTAAKIYNAAAGTSTTAGTGMGDQTVTPTFTVAIPANAYAGTYTSTWTISLVSGP